VSLTQAPVLTLYVPYTESFAGNAALAVKTSDSAAVQGALRDIIRSLDPELAVTAIRTMDGIVDDSLADRRFQMTLVLLLGATATFLAALGIYGLVSQVVAQRLGEIGIRMALGADAPRIMRLILSQGLLPAAVGTVMGVAAALTLAQFLQTLLIGVSATSVTPVATASAFLVGVALLASIVPAWRAARIEPMTSLRCD
jgi:ABC-type antimicrobial peptide transport system permease subunit